MALCKDSETVVGVEDDLLEVGKGKARIQIDGGRATGGNFVLVL